MRSLCRASLHWAFPEFNFKWAVWNGLVWLRGDCYYYVIVLLKCMDEKVWRQHSNVSLLFWGHENTAGRGGGFYGNSGGMGSRGSGLRGMYWGCLQYMHFSTQSWSFQLGRSFCMNMFSHVPMKYVQNILQAWRVWAVAYIYWPATVHFAYWILYYIFCVGLRYALCMYFDSKMVMNSLIPKFRVWDCTFKAITSFWMFTCFCCSVKFLIETCEIYTSME